VVGNRGEEVFLILVDGGGVEKSNESSIGIVGVGRLRGLPAEGVECEVEMGLFDG